MRFFSSFNGVNAIHAKKVNVLGKFFTVHAKIFAQKIEEIKSGVFLGEGAIVFALFPNLKVPAYLGPSYCIDKTTQNHYHFNER